jgi:hypothetical protein
MAMINTTQGINGSKHAALVAVVALSPYINSKCVPLMPSDPHISKRNLSLLRGTTIPSLQYTYRVINSALPQWRINKNTSGSNIGPSPFK